MASRRYVSISFFLGILPYIFLLFVLSQIKMMAIYPRRFVYAFRCVWLVSYPRRNKYAAHFFLFFFFYVHIKQWFEWTVSEEKTKKKTKISRSMSTSRPFYEEEIPIGCIPIYITVKFPIILIENECVMFKWARLRICLHSSTHILCNSIFLTFAGDKDEWTHSKRKQNNKFYR